MTAYNLFCFDSILLFECHGNIYRDWVLWYKSFHAHFQIGSQCFGLKSNSAFSWEIWGATKKARSKRKKERKRHNTDSRTKMSMPIFGLLYREHMHTRIWRTRNDAVIILRFTKHFPSVVKNRSLVSPPPLNSLPHSICSVYSQWDWTCISHRILEKEPRALFSNEHLLEQTIKQEVISMR